MTSTTTIRRLTYELLKPHTALDAARALHGTRDTAALEGLCDLLEAPHSARTGVAAARALAGWDHPVALQTLRLAQQSPHTSIRIESVRALSKCPPSPQILEDWHRMLTLDRAWTVRREVIAALIPHQIARPWLIEALSDPHWRARQDALAAIIEAGWSSPQLQGQLHALALPHGPIAVAAARFAAVAWGQTPLSSPPPPASPLTEAPWWDEDPPVLRQRLRAWSPRPDDPWLDHLPDLLSYPDEGVRRATSRHLRRCGHTDALLAAVRRLDDPRVPFVVDEVERLLGHLNLDRREAMSRRTLLDPHTTSPAQLIWALDQLHEAFPLTDDPNDAPVSQRALTLTTHPNPTIKDAATRAQHRLDPKPPDPPTEPTTPWRARAASLTPTTAKNLWHNPSTETSWHVLTRAARLLGRRLTEIAPPPRPATTPDPPPPSTPDPILAPRDLHPLGASPLRVSRLGISGHYNLPEAGYAQAIEAGVNLFFWEPNYHAQTRFYRSLSPATRASLVTVCGTFEAEPSAIRKDLHRALRHLGLDAIPLFMIFWVRSPSRLDHSLQALLDDLKREGLILAYGLSSHQRPLALQAIHAGWAPLMVRHNAAHRGAEAQLLPTAHTANTGIITFNNLCYGRLLRRPFPTSPPPPTAADCYRYSLLQPGVTACFSAPTTLTQLTDNLRVLDDPNLTQDQITALQQAGDEVHRLNSAFAHHVRSR